MCVKGERVCMYSCVQVCVSVYVRVCVNVYERMYVYLCVSVYVYVRVYVKVVFLCTHVHVCKGYVCGFMCVYLACLCVWGGGGFVCVPPCMDMSVCACVRLSVCSRMDM